MGYHEFFGFDNTAYRAKLVAYSKNKSQHNEIQKREVEKIRQVYGAVSKISLGGAAAFFTGGATLVGSGIGMRQCSIAAQKLEIIQNVMNENNIPFHKEQKRDMVIPMLISLVGVGTGLGVGLGMEEIAAAGVNQAAEAGVHAAAHAGAEATIQTAAAHPGDFIQGAIHGAVSQVEQTASVLLPGDMATNSAQEAISNAVPMTTGASFVNGMNIGYEGLFAADKFVAAVASQKLVDAGLDKMMSQDARLQVDQENSSEKSDGPIKRKGGLRSWQDELEKKHATADDDYSITKTKHQALAKQHDTIFQAVTNLPSSDTAKGSYMSRLKAFRGENGKLWSKTVCAVTMTNTRKTSVAIYEQYEKRSDDTLSERLSSWQQSLDAMTSNLKAWRKEQDAWAKYLKIRASLLGITLAQITFPEKEKALGVQVSVAEIKLPDDKKTSGSLPSDKLARFHAAAAEHSATLTAEHQQLSKKHAGTKTKTRANPFLESRLQYFQKTAEDARVKAKASLGTAIPAGAGVDPLHLAVENLRACNREWEKALGKWAEYLKAVELR